MQSVKREGLVGQQTEQRRVRAGLRVLGDLLSARNCGFRPPEEVEFILGRPAADAVRTAYLYGSRVVDVEAAIRLVRPTSSLIGASQFPTLPLRQVNTKLVIDSYDRELVHAGRKPSTLKTYRKLWTRFERAFEFLPPDRDLILDYLQNFDGPSGRYRLANQDTIHALYKHALALGWLSSDPMAGMKRPKVQEQEPNPLTLEQVRGILALDLSLRERASMHLLAGHGWRQNELLEMTAGEVRSSKGGQVWCHGKERDEFAPILPETGTLLSLLAEGLTDDEQVFRGERGRNERFGYEGMRKLVRGVIERAGLSGFTGHNLRDTFATIVTEASGDLTLAMALIRDKVPGVASRYVKRDLPALLEAHSPLRLLVAPVGVFDSPPSPP